jgi:hypothetical protein
VPNDHQVEARVRAAMARLLSDPIPDGMKCDVKSLCALAGVPRATLYRAYPYLKAEFEHQRGAAQASGRQPDPRLAQIERLKTETTELRERVSRQTAELRALKKFLSEALSRLAAQHDEITALRRAIHAPTRTNVHALATPVKATYDPDQS